MTIPPVNVASAAHARACLNGDTAAAEEAKRLMAAGRVRNSIVKYLPPITTAEADELCSLIRTNEVQS